VIDVPAFGGGKGGGIEAIEELSELYDLLPDGEVVLEEGSEDGQGVDKDSLGFDIIHGFLDVIDELLVVVHLRADDAEVVLLDVSPGVSVERFQAPDDAFPVLTDADIDA